MRWYNKSTCRTSNTCSKSSNKLPPLTFIPASSGTSKPVCMLRVVVPREISSASLTALMLQLPKLISEPMLMVTPVVVTLETGKEYDISESVEDINSSISPSANPLPTIDTFEFKVVEMVPGMETPVNLKVLAGVGSSVPLHPVTRELHYIRKLNIKNGS